MLKKAKLILYLPVIQTAYLELINHFQDKLDQVLIIDDDTIALVDQKLNYLRKDIRRLQPQQAVRALQGYDWPFTVELAKIENLRRLGENPHLQLILPDDDVSQVLIDKFFNKLTRQQIKLEPVFLRWNKQNTFISQLPQVDTTISITQLNRQLMGQAFTSAGNSTDWWRHVGAVLARNGQPLISSFNQHTPGGYTPYIDGDPRSVAKSGQHIEINTSEHAESALIAEAAKRGLSTKGCDLYVTTFPCPYCARVIAHAGIKTLYFAEGYTLLDGEKEMRRAGIKIIKIEMSAKVKKVKDKKSRLKKYQKN